MNWDKRAELESLIAHYNCVCH